MKKTIPNLKQRYQQEIVPKLKRQLDLKNTMAVPKLVKVVVNVGVPKSDRSKLLVEQVKQELATITGQNPKLNRARQAIAGFNLRQGDPIGLSVTLRGQKMFDFIDKLCHLVLPQVKDFRGINPHAFDGQGNYTLGLREQIIFPEIDYSQVNYVHGLEITFVTTAVDDNQAKLLLKEIGLPFAKEEN